MTEVFDSPPPDDGPEWVLAHDPESQRVWVSGKAGTIRAHWGKPWTHWKEMGPPPEPKPEPKPEPVPLEVGMEVRDGDGQPSYVIGFYEATQEVWVHPEYFVSTYCYDVQDIHTLDGRPVCLPPAEEPRPTGKTADLSPRALSYMTWVRENTDASIAERLNYQRCEIKRLKAKVRVQADQIVNLAEKLPPAEEPAPAPPFDIAAWIENQVEMFHDTLATLPGHRRNTYTLLVNSLLAAAHGLPERETWPADEPAPAPPFDLAAWIDEQYAGWLEEDEDEGPAVGAESFLGYLGDAARYLPAPVDRATAETVRERCVAAVTDLFTDVTLREQRYLLRDTALATLRAVDLSDLPEREAAG